MMAYKRISSQPVIEGGTGIMSTTPYSVLCAGSTSTGSFQQVSGFGSTGNVLTSSGTGLPTWQSATGSIGSWVLIQTQNVSSVTSVPFVTGFDGTYVSYALLISNMLMGTTASINMTFSINGGSTYLSSGYVAAVNTIRALPSSSTAWTNTNSIINAPLAASFNPSAGSFPYQAIIYLNGLGNVMNTTWYGNGTYFVIDTADSFYGAFAGLLATTSVNALSIQTSAGTFSASISLYGINR